MFVYHMHTWYTKRAEEGIRSPGTVVIDSCEPPGGCWEANVGLLEEQYVLLTFKPQEVYF